MTAWARRVCACVTGLFLLCMSLPVWAETVEERIQSQREATVESNEIPGWPTGPVVTADSAILIEAETGTVLYAKNIHARQYPASTTKILTTLIAAERCSMDEWVTFSREAVYDTPPDSNHIAMDVGQQLTMEDCLNAILIRSANEVSFAVAEHITGTSWHDFADIMNRRAQELGCVDSHFVNPNGLPDEEHYTSAYDLAMIGKAFFANEMLCRISLTPRLHILPNDHMPYEKLENSKIELLPGKTYGYDDLVGVKTGYTNAARYSVVSCAERDGLKLICVVLRDESPYHYEDTIALFNYGFSNFAKVNVSQVETKYNIDNTGLFYGEHDIFGSSRPLLALNQEDCIVLPRAVDFSEITSVISYDTTEEGQAAVIQYSYQGVNLGSASIDLAESDEKRYDFAEGMIGETENEDGGKAPAFVFVDVKKLSLWAGIGVAAVLALLALRHVLKEYHLPARRTNTRRSWERDRRRHRPREYEDSPEMSAEKLRRQQIREARRRGLRREDEEDAEPGVIRLHRQEVKEARRRQQRREDEEVVELNFRRLHRQEVKEARRRQQRRENEENAAPGFRRLHRQEVMEARRRQSRREYRESEESSFRQVRRQQAKESRRGRRRDRPGQINISTRSIIDEDWDIRE